MVVYIINEYLKYCIRFEKCRCYKMGVIYLDMGEFLKIVMQLDIRDKFQEQYNVQKIGYRVYVGRSC